MSRLDAVFTACAEQHRAALIGYLTAFDPDLERSRERILAACEAGLDVLELGVPFSDPTADGPAIQAAMVRALAAGATVERTLALAADVRERSDVPIVLFSYANPIVRRIDAVRQAAQAGALDAVLVVDMPPEFSEPLRESIRAAGLDWIGLVAPTTPERRIQRIADASSGFVYAVTMRGVTGKTVDVDSAALVEQLATLRRSTTLPIAAGFGIRSADDVAALGRHCDGVVVGSALIRAAEHGLDDLVALVKSLKGALAGKDER
jgi:tryptophan synthase alpha chain